jgi:hypothetical protein
MGVFVSSGMTARQVMRRIWARKKSQPTKSGVSCARGRTTAALISLRTIVRPP